MSSANDPIPQLTLKYKAMAEFNIDEEHSASSRTPWLPQTIFIQMPESTFKNVPLDRCRNPVNVEVCFNITAYTISLHF